VIPFARAARVPAVLALLAASFALAAAASSAPPTPTPTPAPVHQPRLEDFITAPGSSQKLQPFMLQADLWLGLDQRAKLDTIVFALENGARTCQVMKMDSTWAVDYTWVYPHDRFPPRWYDARDLIRTGDSLKLDDAADIRLTFGTLRVGVRAKTLKQATAEAYRLWPHEIPPAMQGRLKLKLERAKKAMAGQKETEPEFPEKK
jgi:hypothetical protein